MPDTATKVRDVMTPDPHVIGPNETLDRAYAAMKEGGFRHLPVLDGSRIVGILSTTDIGRLGATVPELMARPVADFMSPDPLTVGPDEPIEAAAGQMGLRKVNCLLVVAAGQLVGIVTTYDLLDALARQLAPRSARSSR